MDKADQAAADVPAVAVLADMAPAADMVASGARAAADLRTAEGTEVAIGAATSVPAAATGVSYEDAGHMLAAAGNNVRDAITKWEENRKSGNTNNG